VLESLVLHSRVLRRFVMRVHQRALSDLIVQLPPVRRVAIVGGGLFPRTALILRSLVPDAEITIIDAKSANLDRARMWIRSVSFLHAYYRSDTSGTSDSSEAFDTGAYDLVVIPLAFDGDREALYVRPPARAVIVHDWIWRKRGVSCVVSVALLKRVNLICR